MTPSGSNPGETFCSRTKLRTSRPAPMSSMSDNATSETTSRLRSRRLELPNPPSPCVFRPPALSDVVEIDLGGAQRRREAEHEAGENRDAEGECEDGAVERDRVEPRDVAGIDGAHDVARPSR